MISQNLFEDVPMTFGEHLEELRKHLIRAGIGVVIAFISTTFFADRVVALLADPVSEAQEKWFEKRYPERAEKVARELDSSPFRWVTLQLQVPKSVLQPNSKDVKPAENIPPTPNPGNAPPPGSDPASKTDPAGQQGANANAKPVEMSTIEVKMEASAMLRAMVVPLSKVTQPWRLKSLQTQEAFMIYFKAMFGAGIVLASPWIFWQIYSFIAVGLYAHERRFVRWTLPFCVILFLSGVALCYFGVFPVMIQFFLGANDWMDIEPNTSLSEWVGFAVIMMLIFGVMFQLPLFMLILERIGLISYDMLVSKRRHAILINFIVAAIVTPTSDPQTLCLLAVPMCLLFEVGLLLVRYFQRTSPFAAESTEEAPPFELAR